MRKVFLFIGLAAFTAASAQQNDLFDIQKYLLKKSDDNNKLFENKNIDMPFKKPFIYNPPPINNNPVETYTLSNGDKVVISSLYNMPVVQPDMRQFKIMPNLAYEGQFNFSPHQVLPGQIPNGSKPYVLISSR